MAKNHRSFSETKKIIPVNEAEFLNASEKEIEKITHGMNSPYLQACKSLLHGLKNIIFFYEKMTETHHKELSDLYKKISNSIVLKKAKPQEATKAALLLLEEDFLERMGLNQLSELLLSSTIGRKSVFREEIENKLNGKTRDYDFPRLEGLFFKKFNLEYRELIPENSIFEAVSVIKIPLSYYDKLRFKQNSFREQFKSIVLSENANQIMDRLNDMIEQYKKFTQINSDKLIKLREKIFKEMQAAHPDEQKMLQCAYSKISDEFEKCMKGTFSEVTTTHLNENKDKQHEARLLGLELKELLNQMQKAGTELDNKQKTLLAKTEKIEGHDSDISSRW
ncbi:MAG TPA: hypothetical protein VLI69_08270 [Gammaproteobacteria bacterium]|nr:hypothetical protein [Gammaproteobacteria bacterium]